MRHSVASSQGPAMAFVVIAFTGCATTAPSPTKEDAGPYPFNHEAIFGSYLSRVLKDPFSAQVRTVAGPAPYNRAGGLMTSALAGWGTCYLVNAKNSFGAYTGEKWYLAILRDDSVADVIAQEGGHIYRDIEISKFCKAAGAPNSNAPHSTPAVRPTRTTTPESNISRELLATLKPGVTTRAEVVSLFGTPTSISSMHNGTLLQWITPASRAHVAILFGNDREESMVQITHSFFQ